MAQKTICTLDTFIATMSFSRMLNARIMCLPHECDNYFAISKFNSASDTTECVASARRMENQFMVLFRTFSVFSLLDARVEQTIFAHNQCYSTNEIV